MNTAPNKVLHAISQSHSPVSFHANTHPAHTGTIAAGSVFGRAARTIDLSGIFATTFC
jgi:hypothetical protein